MKHSNHIKPLRTVVGVAFWVLALGAASGQDITSSLSKAAVEAKLSKAVVGQSDSGTRRPNFVVIYTDDQRSDAVGYANTQVHTPTLDAFATDGTRFSNAFVATSVCSPSRAALLTGRYGSANGVLRYGMNQGLDPGETTVAQHLARAGYRTGHVGKWHLAQPPDALGFKFTSYFTSNGPYYRRDVIEAGAEESISSFIEEYNAQRAADFLEKAAAGEAPFFLSLATQVPHMNHELEWPASDSALALYERRAMPVPPSWQSDLSGKPSYLKSSRARKRALEYGYDQKQNIRQHFAHYYGTITDMDAALAPVFEKLERLGLQENTYVFFMGDNGWMMGEHGFTSKVLPYEPSIRVPFAVDGPGVQTQTCDHLVLNVDIAPTMMQLAGLSVPQEMHGRSLVPLLFGGETDSEWRERFLYEAPVPQLGSWPLQAVRTERWKYVQTFDLGERDSLVFEELYDLKNDPHEARNLAGDPAHQERLERLRTDLQQLRDSIPRADHDAAAGAR